jgi:S-adenosylmethionine hydrolase
MFVTIINDCRDENVMMRQATRALTLFSKPVVTAGVANDIEAAGNLIDALDASEGGKGVILLNVAPRHGKAKKWPNGTPFGYFHYKDILIVASIDGYCLSLAKKFNLTDTIHVMDIPTVVASMIAKGEIGEEMREYIVNTQFRSFDFVPRAGKWILDGFDVPFEKYPIANVEDISQAVWWVDNFGNCKTTILPEEIGFEPGKVMKTAMGDITCYYRLKDVPNDQPGLIIGSSGLGKKRFIEFVIQGKSAAERYNLTSGSKIFG